MGKIIYTSPFVPPEWIAAHGFEPLRLVPGTASGLEGPVKSNEGVCPFLRLFVNAAVAESGAAGLVLATSCDQMRHARDVLDGAGTVPSFLLHLPSAWQTPTAHGLYGSEVRRLGRFLETLGGAAPSRDRLSDVMDRYDRDRCVAATGSAAAPAMSPGQRSVAVALLGGPLTAEDRGIGALVVRYGGRVVLDATEEGERCRPARFDRRRMWADPLGVLTEAYYGFIPDVFLRPNGELFRWVQRETQARAVRGVILLRQVWCDKWHAEVHRFREWLKVPLLDVDLDGEVAGERTRTRIQAFLESLR